jgi:N-acetylglutamate synthase-like GNAT family acetyltransferase
VILRHARSTDQVELEHFDVGPTDDRWLVEVAEIVSGLLAWRDSPADSELHREILVLENDNAIVAVAALELLRDERGRPYPLNRYLMVTAVRGDQRRSGLAKLLVESIVNKLQQSGARSVDWLVHPANNPSIQFSRNTFPTADEAQPPEDKPYVRFSVSLVEPQ